MPELPKVKYWSSSPLVVPPDAAFHGGIGGTRNHLVLMSVQIPDKPEQTIQIAKCISGAVSARIAIALDKFEKGLEDG